MKNTTASWLGTLVIVPLLIGAGCSSGGGILAGGPKDCKDDEKCFEEQFKDCKPALFSATVQSGLVYQYEITKKKDGKCEVKSKFTENTLAPQLIGKEGFCLYNNTKSFKDASAEISGSGLDLPKHCQGPLVDELNKMINPGK